MATKEFNRLASTALSLPARQRAKLAQALWTSISDSQPAKDASNSLRRELRRRDTEITRGKVRCKEHTEVMKAAREALAR
jgi:putative addiction module component (TIGR02574 family)